MIDTSYLTLPMLYLCLILVDQVGFEVDVAVLGVLEKEGSHFLQFEPVHVREIIVLHLLWKFDVHHFIVDVIDHRCRLSSSCLVFFIAALTHRNQLLFIPRPWRCLEEHWTPHRLSIVIQQRPVKSLNTNSLTSVHVSHNVARNREFLIDMVAVCRKRNEVDHLQHILNSRLAQVDSSEDGGSVGEIDSVEVFLVVDVVEKSCVDEIFVEFRVDLFFFQRLPCFRGYHESMRQAVSVVDPVDPADLVNSLDDGLIGNIAIFLSLLHEYSGGVLIQQQQQGLFGLKTIYLLGWLTSQIISYNHLGRMREVIFVNVGGAGVKMGDQQWQKFAAEHRIDNEGNKQEQTCFNDVSIFYQKSDGKKVPRNMFVDTGPEDVDQVRAGSRRNLYNRRNSVSGKEDSANYCVRGMYTIGKNQIDEVLNKIRIQTQACDHFGGFVFNCSMSGGTGSGMTNLLTDRLAIMHPKTTIGINMAIPSPNMTDIIVEPYNFVFSAGELMSDTNRFVIGYDSQRMYKTCENEGIDQPGQHQVNEMIASSISWLTSRFRSKQGNDFFGDINTNLIPYKKMFFLSPSYAKTQDSSQSATFAQSLYEHPTCLNSYRSMGHQKIMSSYAMLRGQITHFEALTALTRKKKHMSCLQWSPTNLKVTVSPYSLRSSSTENSIEGTMLVNSSSIIKLFDIQTSKFDRLYEKRAFIHWYVGEGLDNGFINQNRERIEYLKRDYQQMTL